MPSIFILISTALALISPIIYSIAILKGEAKPHRTTRLVLLIITSLTTASLLAQGNRVAVYLAGVSTLQSIVIFTLSIKHGMGGWNKSDIICLVFALFGIVLWQITKDPAIGLYFAIGADFIGMIPAIVKTYHFPKTEIWLFFGLDIFASLFSLLALNSWTLQEFSYPVYIMLINTFMALLIVRPKNMDIVVKKSKVAGKGIFANKDFKKGEIVLIWYPKALTKKEFDGLSDQEKHYIDKVDGKIFLMQAPERYINHSCDSNTKPVNQTDIAIKNIKKGEEITSNYSGTSNPDFTCNCGSKNCKGFFTDKNNSK